MEHVFSKEVIDEVLDYTFQLVKENRTLYYDSNPNVASAFLHNELNNVGLDTMLNLKHLSCYNVTLRIDNLQDKIDAVVCQSGDGSISGEDSADLLTKTKTFILETLNWAFDESNTEHSQRRQDLLRPHFSDLECKIVHDTIQLFFYSRLVEIEEVGPVIDGDLVLQGVSVNPTQGPAIAVVEFSPSTSEHHITNADTYTEIMRVMPWQMMYASPTDSGGLDPSTFAIPIQLPTEYKSMAGSIRVKVYCDDASVVPYCDEVADFSISERMTLVYDIFTPSFVGRVAGETFDPDTGVVTFEEGGSSFSGAHFRKVLNVLVATDYDEISAMKERGLDLITTKINIDSYPDAIDDSSQYWKFHLMVEYSEDVIHITPDGQLHDSATPPDEQNCEQYIGDVMFVTASKGNTTIPEVNGYEILFDTDLSDLEDPEHIYIAVKKEDTPVVSSVEMIYCNAPEDEPLDVYLKRRGLDKKHCKYIEAPSLVQERNGGRCGILLAYIVGDLSTYDMTHHRHHHHRHNHHDTESHTHADGVMLVDNNTEEPETSATVLGTSTDFVDGVREEENEAVSVHSKLSDDLDMYNEDGVEETEEETCDRLNVEIEKMEKEKFEIHAANLELQKKALVLFLKEKSMQLSSKKGDGEEEQLSVDQITLKEKQYKDTVVAISNGHAKLKKQDSEFNQLAFDLQQRLDDKEYKANIISESFRSFKKEILTKAIDSRTGKTISAKLVKKFESAESKWEEDLEKVRLKNISLRMQLKKLERRLKATEQVAEGLHMIDFEQLKIENQTLNEKIEERQEELSKLKRKKTITVQVLSHIREKLHFIANKNSTLQEELTEYENDILGKRADLSVIKKDKDHVKVENTELRRKQGFSTNTTLLHDFSKGHNLMEIKMGTINEYKEKASLLTSMIRENEKTIEFNSFSKKGSYNTTYK